MSGDTNHSAITVAGVAGRGWSSQMVERFRQTPALLKPSANKKTCCIFKVPKRQVGSDAKPYEPRLVSVGPYHHGKGHLQMIEQHKPRLFSALLNRTRGYGACLDRYLEDVALLETRIRDSYSEDLDCKTLDLIEMMILDACFLVEMFRVAASVIEPDEGNPLFDTPRIISFFTIDLLLIENQIPFFVLQKIYDLSKSPEEAGHSLEEIAFGFFKNALRLSGEELKRHCQVSDAKHLLDLLRLSLVGHLELENPQAVDEDLLQPVPSTVQMLFRGIKFQPKTTNRLIDVVFINTTLQIPPLTLDAFTSSFFLNCVAFEQCYCCCSKHITAYVLLMRCLVKTAEDAKFLSDSSIITNLLGTNNDVAKFFDDLTKDVQFDMMSSYLAGLFGQVTKHCQSRWRIRLTALKLAYFNDPKTLMSLYMSMLAIYISIIQVVLAIYPVRTTKN